MERTHTQGFELRCERNITKGDMVDLCRLLNDEYKNNRNHAACTFEPEPISEGGIQYKFSPNNSTYSKSVRFSGARWPWINDNVMLEWDRNEDVVFAQGTEFTIFLKSSDGAPLFTLPELKKWAECFERLGMKKKGRYPSKKSLTSFF